MGTILEPSVVSTLAAETDQTNLVKENYLSEFETEDEKSVVRANLNVYDQETVYTKDESEQMVNEKLKTVLSGYVTSDELPAAVNTLAEQVAAEDYVKSNGSVPFTSPQSQTALPTDDSHLTNKLYVDNQLTAHLNAYDPHGTIEQVQSMLASYAKLSDTYTTKKVYTKKETESLLSDYTKRDGTVSFTAPVSGVDPKFASHLTTKRYVQGLMDEHKNEENPHNFTEILRKTLSNYYTKSETYTKAQTFSRLDLTDIIKKQMNDVVEQALSTFKANEGSLSELRDWVLKQLYSCVKTDGTTTYSTPQAGVAAVNDNEFVVLSQLEDAVDEAISTMAATTDGAVWITSGPVEATVGLVDEGTVFQSTMTLQQVCDAIFYGSQTVIEAPEYASYGDEVCVTLRTHGTGTLEQADIYKNGDLVATVYPDDFIVSDTEGCYYIWCDPEPFEDETVWDVTFTYTDGNTITDSVTTKLAYPIFIGAIPYWWNAQEDITFENLKKLAEVDPDNNWFFTNYGPDVESLEASFNFSDSRKRSIVVIVPYDYNSLTGMDTTEQHLSEKAFVMWTQPMYPGNTETGVLYKIYVYNQPLVEFDGTITFTFAAEEKD